MGTTAEKLTHLSQTKSDIRDAIIAKGVSVPVETTFRDYATKVSDIKTDFSDTFNFAERVSQDGGSVENLSEVANLDFNDGAKLNFIPSGKKAGKSYSQVPTDGSGDFTVDRNSTASYIAEDGTIQFANANEPRFDWSSGKPALLVEPQRTNLVVSSEGLVSNTGSRTEINCNLTENTTLDSMGHKLYSIVSNNINAQLNIYTNITNGNTYTCSIYVHKDSSHKKIGFHGFGNGINGVVFDIENNITQVNANWLTAKIEPVIGNQNYLKLSASIIPLSNGTWAIDFDYQMDGDNRNLITVGNEILFSCIQLEEGSTATSYIKTEGATVTRLADIIETTPPAGTTQIIETIDGVEQTPITTIPATYQIPEGNINQIKML